MREAHTGHKKESNINFNIETKSEGLHLNKRRVKYKYKKTKSEDLYPKNEGSFKNENSKIK